MQDTGDLMAYPPRQLDQEFYQDPHGLYERLGEEGPVRPVVLAACETRTRAKLPLSNRRIPRRHVSPVTLALVTR